MPIYEYKCDGCSEVFEVFQKHSDPPPAEHSCGSKQMHRVLSNTSFVLKGTGWYATDYAQKDKGGESASKRRRASEEKADGGTKTESSKDSGSSSGGSTPAAASSDASSSSTPKTGAS